MRALMSLLAALYRLLDRLCYGLAALVMVAVTVASFSPKGSAGDPGSADKTLHVLIYAAAVLPAAVAPYARVLLVAAGIFAWGGGIELLQPAFGRSASVADLVANAVGLSLGALLGYPLRRVLRSWLLRD